MGPGTVSDKAWRVSDKLASNGIGSVLKGAGKAFDRAERVSRGAGMPSDGAGKPSDGAGRASQGAIFALLRALGEGKKVTKKMGIFLW